MMSYVKLLRYMRRERANLRVALAEDFTNLEINYFLRRTLFYQKICILVEDHFLQSRLSSEDEL